VPGPFNLAAAALNAAASTRPSALRVAPAPANTVKSELAAIKTRPLDSQTCAEESLSVDIWISV
jgi:hypothetical protein